MFAINLGGEGEIPGVLNQQRPFCLTPAWLSLRGETIAQMTARGIPVLICPNDALALPDESVDVVYTNSVPINTNHSFYGLGVQRSEIMRILKSGGTWIDTDSNGLVVIWVKP